MGVWVLRGIWCFGVWCCSGGVALAVASADLEVAQDGGHGWVPVCGMVVSGALLGMMGVVLNLRRMALIGDVMSHAVLPGAACGMMAGGARDSWLTFVGAGLGALPFLRGDPRADRSSESSKIVVFFGGCP